MSSFHVVWKVVPVSKKKSSSYIKLLTTRSVDYFKYWGHDFCKETLLLRFSNVFFGTVSNTFSPIIFEERHKSLRLISPKQNRLD